MQFEREGTLGLGQQDRAKDRASSGSDICGIHHQILDPDRKAAHPNSRRVPYRVGHRTGRAGNADFANALDAKRVHMGIVLLDHQRF